MKGGFLRAPAILGARIAGCGLSRKSSCLLVVGGLLASFPRLTVARPVMMVWEEPDAYLSWEGSADGYIGRFLGHEVTDFAVGVSARSLAQTSQTNDDIVRQMMNDVAMADGIRCWVSVKGADVDVSVAALARYLAYGLVFDFSDDARAFPPFAERAHAVRSAAQSRREQEIALAFRFGAVTDLAELAALVPAVEKGAADYVIAPSAVLRELSRRGLRKSVRLIADDQPAGEESPDFCAWFARGLDAGFDGFCFPNYRAFPYETVPFLTFRRLSRAALEEYETLNLIPCPKKLTRGEGFVSGSEIDFAEDATVPHEGYGLSIGAAGIRVRSSDAAGRFHAERTLAQLRRPDGTYPTLEIEDAPAFRWRGVQMDESRHFFGKTVVKKLLDTMAQYKLNVFHWHLTDSDGWRLDIPEFPELVKYGSVRPSGDAFGSQFAVVNGKYKRKGAVDEQVYGPFYYTEKDVREIIAYAAARHIEVVPEVDFPGHFAAALSAYPEYACDPSAVSDRIPNCSNLGGRDGDDVETSSRRSCARNVMCLGNDDAIAFLEKVLDYVCRVFPAPYVNIGGDECPTFCWRECEKCRRRMREIGLKDAKDLQAWLTRHFVRFLEARGKRVMGYDEMLVGDVPKSTVGWYWRPERWIGRRGMPEVRTLNGWATLGYDMVNCDWDYTYFYGAQGLDEDPFMYGHNVPLSKRPFGGDALSLEKAYSFDPARGVAAENLCHVLGGVCSNWSEFTWNRYDFEWKLWPRGLAFAEVLWCGRSKPGYADFLRRARVERRRLIRSGVNCAPVEERE